MDEPSRLESDSHGAITVPAAALLGAQALNCLSAAQFDEWVRPERMI